MRLSGEISDTDEEERETEVNSLGVGFPLPQNLVVGYALTSKKKKSFLQPKLVGLARNKGISFVSIDRNRPLSDQGPFDVVLHKDYRVKHPEVTVLDPPYAIQHVYNRQSMLENVADLNLPECHGKVGVPKQLVIEDLLSIPDEVRKAGLKLPLGGVLFKVYIIGETIKVVRRFSLPDVGKPELSKVAGVFRFPRVSCAAASADDANLDPAVAELPPKPLLERLAKELRLRMGLQLFNIDIIRENGTRDLYYVIDINYFPGK
ncbi:inositol 1,3,4-trisphosphate 5/6-kinase family protein [Actinidia rufa]|uniref:Inositol 1,3,4-trisphosphate 5/6-kinase family protein n=1 Tax=Actinidia rufa TaxID=165716 RepID=A0A7J0H1G6_9ERIC|nr:inositol 1,3,4-trisphosphate 5/6-kinase family protein [Actinidia rufa]